MRTAMGRKSPDLAVAYGEAVSQLIAVALHRHDDWDAPMLLGNLRSGGREGTAQDRRGHNNLDDDLIGKLIDLDFPE